MKPGKSSHILGTPDAGEETVPSQGASVRCKKRLGDAPAGPFPREAPKPFLQEGEQPVQQGGLGALLSKTA
jgi:hypothetical protein